VPEAGCAGLAYFWTDSVHRARRHAATKPRTPALA